MTITLMPPLVSDLCAPISGFMRPLSDCRVANMTLREWVTSRLELAGFVVINPEEANNQCVRIPIDHIPEYSTLYLLAHAVGPKALKTPKGEILAWVNTLDPMNCPNCIVTEAPAQHIRYLWDMLDLNAEILRNMPQTPVRGSISHLAAVDGRLHLGEGSVIHHGTVIEGDVIIGKNCKIGPNAYIRGATSVGDNCVIGHAVEVKNSIIYDNTHIAHLSYVGDSIVGSHVNVGAGCIFSNYRHDGLNNQMMVNGELIDTKHDKLGAMVGDGVKLGANSVICPGRKIGRGRMTDPGTIIRHDMA
ncbi:DapH/DapD/GlmU-related protein [Akkermansia glycaniphila]|uniref:Trimeric lpxa-like n=1 Tax=Akkermansia glycaniphila TaxID=1679444 RepID=A0A1H6LAC7_9BACT|nr:DapH/DapD/GlmU-related protein [Akkermansia glycaniphila]MBT9449272.1 hypothetical protein [Akkermansia glycaniphila]SEH85232.1 trimeric lpxa-like [Akkermansia glycaniphila]